MQAMQDGVLATGIPSQAELEASPGYLSAAALARGPMVVIECVQDIPCNPCELVCPNGAIHVGEPITNLPVFLADECDGCSQCIPVCPDQAIFRVDMTCTEGRAAVSFPMSFCRCPVRVMWSEG